MDKMPGGGIRKTPYITKNPAYDSFKCECGALLRLKSPSSIEEHRNRVSHKKLMEQITSTHHLNFPPSPFPSPSPY